MNRQQELEVAFWKGWMDAWMESYALDPLRWKRDGKPLPNYKLGNPQEFRST